MQKKLIIILIGIFAIIILLLAGFHYVLNPEQDLNESNYSNDKQIYFSNFTANFTAGDLQLGSYYQNYTPKLIINCEPFKSMSYVTETYQFWIYSQCAIIETNPMAYDKSLEKYHVCFKLENKSVGDCTP